MRFRPIALGYKRLERQIGHQQVKYNMRSRRALARETGLTRLEHNVKYSKCS